MRSVKHLTMAELEAGLDHVLQSPKDEGELQMIVRRPRVNEREILTEAQLHPAEGLVGDNWKTKGSRSTPDGAAHPQMQLNIMNARVIALVSQAKDRWPLAGDQLYIDLDLSAANLPPGTLLAIGSAVVEVTAVPHTGCHKFKARFGRDAMKFVNASRDLHFRGINAKVVRAGTIRVGDLARKLRSVQPVAVGDVHLREVAETDLAEFFEHQRHPAACQMAAFPPRDRDAFMAHWIKLLADDNVIKRTILVNTEVAGNVVCWEQSGQRLIGYWLGSRFWGQGIASCAVKTFVSSIPARPLHAHVAKSNVASIRVLEKCGFRRSCESRSAAPTGGEVVEEFVYALD